MKRKFIYLFIALAATILPAHAQKFLNDALTLSNVSLWQQGNSLYVGMTVDMKDLTIGSARSLSLIPLLTDGQHNVPLQEIIVNGKDVKKHTSVDWQSAKRNLPLSLFLIKKEKHLIIRKSYLTNRGWQTLLYNLLRIYADAAIIRK